jgi:hypothetical protein
VSPAIVDGIFQITNADQTPAGLTNGTCSAAQSEVSEFGTMDFIENISDEISTQSSEPDDQVCNDPTLDLGISAITWLIADGVVDNDSVEVLVRSVEIGDTL